VERMAKGGVEEERCKERIGGKEGSDFAHTLLRSLRRLC